MTDINPKLLKEIEKASKQSVPSVYRKIAKIQNDLYLEKPIAALVLARDSGVNITKYASADDLEILRSTQYSLSNSASDTNNREIQKAKPPKIPKISVPPGVESDEFLTNSDRTSSISNAEVYPIVYLFENSVRMFVSTMMELDYGKNWWKEKIEKDKPKVASNVTTRMAAEKDFPWHSRRNAKPIYYTDIKDLTNIINTYHSKGKFKTALGKKKERVLVWIEDIEKTRNIIAHNNPVSKVDRDRLRRYAHDWHIFATSVYKNLKL